MEHDTLLVDRREGSVLAARSTPLGPAATPLRALFAAAPHESRIRPLRDHVECRAILARLQEEVGFTGSHSELWRFVRSLEPATPAARHPPTNIEARLVKRKPAAAGRSNA